MSLIIIMDFSSYYHQKIHNLNNIISNLNKQITHLQLQLQTEKLEKEWYKSKENHDIIKNEKCTQTPIIYLKETICQTDIFFTNTSNDLFDKSFTDNSTNTSNDIFHKSFYHDSTNITNDFSPKILCDKSINTENEVCSKILCDTTTNTSIKTYSDISINTYIKTFSDVYTTSDDLYDPDKISQISDNISTSPQKNDLLKKNKSRINLNRGLTKI